MIELWAIFITGGLFYVMTMTDDLKAALAATQAALAAEEARVQKEVDDFKTTVAAQIADLKQQIIDAANTANAPEIAYAIDGFKGITDTLNGFNVKVDVAVPTPPTPDEPKS